MQTTSEGKAVAASLLREAAQIDARARSAAADDAEFEAEERRLWNATPEMLDALVKASLEIGNAVKSGRNEHDKYDYGTLEDYLDAARRPLLEHGLLLVSRPVGDPVLTEARANSGNALQIARVLVETRVIHAATKGWIAARVWGEGRDRGDKAIYKALTGGRKYALAMVLGIYTTDEPENDSPEAAAPTPKRAPRPTSPADSARPPAPAEPEAWTEEAQAVLVTRISELRGDADQSFAAKARTAADYIAKKRPAMSDEQAQQVVHALLGRCDTLRREAPHLMTAEEGQVILRRVAPLIGLTPASSLPAPDAAAAAEEHAHEMEGAAVDSGHV